MAKEITSNVVAEIDKVSNQPVLLIALTLTNAGILRFAATKNNIIWTGQTWTARSIQISETTQNAEGQIGEMSIDFDNTDNTMSSYLVNEDFNGNPIIVYRIFRNLTSGVDFVEVFRGTTEEVTFVSRTTFTLKATTGKPLRRSALTRLYSLRCNHIFGDTRCNQDGYSNLAALTVEDVTVSSGSTDYVVGAKTDLGPIDSGTTNFWKYGKLEFWVKGSGTTYVRTVTTSSSGTSKLFLDVPMTSAIDNTYTYNVYKGCNKTWNTCISADNGMENKSGSSIAWGPSANNEKNFQGFITIAQTRETGTLY